MISSYDCGGAPSIVQEGEKSSKLCLGVVGARGADVVLFDSLGNPRTFSHKGDAARKLCFSTHGIGAEILTHCFDEDGIHGTPVNECYCGLHTPHLHAHVHDPKRCGNGGGENNNVASHDSCIGADTTTNDFASLGVVTLHPVEPLQEANGEYKPLVSIPISAELPNQCNSSEMSRHMMAYGIDPAVHAEQGMRRRIHQIQHDDHIDYLVHDSSTGHLHLEHPDCTSCGQNDVHGLFKCVGKRRCQDATGSRVVQVHIFEASSRPFSILDFIHDLFDPTSSLRVAAARPDAAHKEVQQTDAAHRRSTMRHAVPEAPPVEGAVLVRSTFMCTQICCSSEVPMIRSVLNPLDGVERIMVNVPLKQVLVDHDPSVITASGIETILNKERFGASIKMDGGASALASNSTNGRSQFLVQHICCASEVPAINKVVLNFPGVSNVSVSVPTKMVYVDHDTIVVSAQQICDALNMHQFGATLKRDAGKELTTSLASVICESTLSWQGGAQLNQESVEKVLAKFDPSELESYNLDVHNNKIVVVHKPLELSVNTIIVALDAGTGGKFEAVVDGAAGKPIDEAKDSESPSLPNIYVLLSGLFLAISILSYIGDNWHYLKYVAAISIACGLPPIALKAFHTLQRYQFDTNCLMLFAILGAIALEDFVEGGAVTFLFGISEWLELRATSRARTALSSIVSLRPEYANLVHPATNEIVVVPASSVPIGALVSVKPGDKVPCDGVVVEGTSTVDESSLTGESRPIRKAPEDDVSGGTINSGFTQLTVRTTSTADNSAVARLIRLVEEAQANRSQTEKIVEEFARYYTPLIVLGALIMCSIPWIYGRAEGKRWCHNGLVLMVVACPCSLIISTPVAYVAGLAASAQRGILIKGGAHLESLGLVKNIAFDKTGTLTQGQFALLHLEVVGSQRTRKEVLEMLSLMEERASHPLSQAILMAARNEGVSSPKHLAVLNHTFLAGEGVQGSVNGSEVYVGNERLFRRLGLFDSLPENIKATCQLWASTGGTVGFMSIEGDGIVCIYSVADAVRPEAKEVVESLQRMGITLSMLTGDNSDTALAIGEQIGLSESEIRSRLLPEEKLSIVTDMKAANSSRSVVSNPLSKPCLVLMCGDGVNDAPAMAAADVSVAMGAGAALAMETSDVTLLDSDLRKLVYSIRMGRRVIRKIKENIIFSVVVKVIVVGFAVAGKTRLWAAIFSDVGAMILVTLNGMSLLPGQKEAKGAVSGAKTVICKDDHDVEAFYVDAHGGSTHWHGHGTVKSPDGAGTCGHHGHGCCGRPCGTSQSDQGCGNVGCHDDSNVSDCHDHGCCRAPVTTKEPGAHSHAHSSCASGCCHDNHGTKSHDHGCCGPSVCEKEQCDPEAQSACASGCCHDNDHTPNSRVNPACVSGCCHDDDAPSKKEVSARDVHPVCESGCCHDNHGVDGLDHGCRDTHSKEKKPCCDDVHSACASGCCHDQDIEVDHHRGCRDKVVSVTKPSCTYDAPTCPSGCCHKEHEHDHHTHGCCDKKVSEKLDRHGSQGDSTYHGGHNSKEHDHHHGSHCCDHHGAEHGKKSDHGDGDQSCKNHGGEHGNHAHNHEHHSREHHDFVHHNHLNEERHSHRHSGDELLSHEHHGDGCCSHHSREGGEHHSHDRHGGDHHSHDHHGDEHDSHDHHGEERRRHDHHNDNHNHGEEHHSHDHHDTNHHSHDNDHHRN